MAGSTVPHVESNEQSALETIRQSIARLREIEAKATPGPWIADDMSPRFIWTDISEGQPNESIVKVYTQKTEADQKLITSSRNSILPLLESLEKASEAAMPLLEAIPHANEDVLKEWRRTRIYQVKVPIGELMDLQDALSSIAATMKAL